MDDDGRKMKEQEQKEEEFELSTRDENRIKTEETPQDSPAQDPSLSICYSLTTFNLPRHLFTVHVPLPCRSLAKRTREL